MSILKDLIDLAAGLMGMLFEKTESSFAAGTEAAEGDDLTQIDGIGPTYAHRLSAGGVDTFAQLAVLSPEQIREIAQATPQADPTAWIAEAQSLT